MSDWLFRKVELWLVAVIVLLSVPLSVFWGMRIVEQQAYPWPIIAELRAFAAGDQDEDISLGQKILALFGAHNRFEVEQTPDDQRPVPVAGGDFTRSVKGVGYEFSTSLDTGYYLMYGVMDISGGKDYNPTAILLDSDGQIKRSWLFPFGGPTNSIKRMAYSQRGTLVSTASERLRAQDWCGNALWESEELGFHHEIDVGDGQFMVWLRDKIVRVDEASGALQDVIDMRKIILANPDFPLLRTTLKFFKYHQASEQLVFDDKQPRPEGTPGRNIVYFGDPFHQNKAAPNRGVSDAFPANAIAISFRQQDLVAIIDPESGRILWHEIYNRQHDPDWLPDGLLVYNNNSHFPHSRIEFAGFDGRREVVLGEQQFPWSRRITGNQQLYEDGSLVFQGNDGYVHHISAEGQLLTTFFSNALLRNGYYLSDEEVARFERGCT